MSILHTEAKLFASVGLNQLLGPGRYKWATTGDTTDASIGAETVPFKVPRNSVPLKYAPSRSHRPSHPKHLKLEGSHCAYGNLILEGGQVILGNVRERVADTAISQTMGPVNACL